jgi:hypothetical protein
MRFSIRLDGSAFYQKKALRVAQGLRIRMGAD